VRGLTFLDSTGVHLFLRWTAWAGSREDGFRLVAGPRRIGQVLAMTGVLPQLRFTESAIAP
jgi:anti-anti-sigma regulatory factor